MRELRSPLVQIDAAVAGATLGLGLLAGVLIGLVSASPLYTMRLGTMLHGGSRSGTHGRALRATRRTLVVAQMACSFVLLMGSALLWVSLRNALAVDPGFRTENVITGAVSLPAARFASDDAARAFLKRSLASIRQLPGVAAAGATTIVPLGGNSQSGVIVAEGYVLQARGARRERRAQHGHARLFRSRRHAARSRPLLRRARQPANLEDHRHRRAPGPPVLARWRCHRPADVLAGADKPAGDDRREHPMADGDRRRGQCPVARTVGRGEA